MKIFAFLVCTVNDEGLMTIEKIFLSKLAATKWMEHAQKVYNIINKVKLIMIEKEVEDGVRNYGQSQRPTQDDDREDDRL